MESYVLMTEDGMYLERCQIKGLVGQEERLVVTSELNLAAVFRTPLRTVLDKFSQFDGIVVQVEAIEIRRVLLATHVVKNEYIGG